MHNDHKIKEVNFNFLFYLPLLVHISLQAKHDKKANRALVVVVVVESVVGSKSDAVIPERNYAYTTSCAIYIYFFFLIYIVRI